MSSLNRTKAIRNGLENNRMRRSGRILEPENIRNGRLLRGTSSALQWRANAIFCLLLVLSLHISAFAQQDPCAEVGMGCRPLSTSEVEALKERFLALRDALPVPDTARWAIPEEVDEAYTTPFIGELKYGGAMVCVSWPAGCFPEKNDVNFVYSPVKATSEPIGNADETTDETNPEMSLEELAASAQGILADFANRIEVYAELLPCPYLVDEVDGKCVDVTDPDAVTIENSPTFLAWESGDRTSLTMVFGRRTCKEDETLRIEKPEKSIAPVKSIVLEVVGPSRDEVDSLKQKINRKAFEALLGDVVK